MRDNELLEPPSVHAGRDYSISSDSASSAASGAEPSEGSAAVRGGQELPIESNAAEEVAAGPTSLPGSPPTAGPTSPQGQPPAAPAQAQSLSTQAPP